MGEFARRSGHAHDSPRQAQGRSRRSTRHEMARHERAAGDESSGRLCSRRFPGLNKLGELSV